MIEPDAFFAAMNEQADSGGSPATISLATVDPAYNGTGNPKITFEGETLLTAKTYPYLDEPPKSGSRVAVVPSGSTHLILGVINGAALPPPVIACTSTTRPAGPVVPQQIFETDTGYVRIWNGTAWQFLSGPEISAYYTAPSTSSILGNGNRTVSWNSVPRVGDISGTASRITFNRAGWYDLRSQIRLDQEGTAGERFIAISLFNSGGSEIQSLHHNQYTSWYASLCVGGPTRIPSSGCFAQTAIYSSQDTTLDSGWHGLNFNAYFLRPLS